MARLKRYTPRALIAIGGLMLALFAYQLFFAAPRDETRIQRTVEAVATSGNPAYCLNIVTPAYLRQMTGAPARYALDACRQQAHFSRARSVAVSATKIDGDRA